MRHDSYTVPLRKTTTSTVITINIYVSCYVATSSGHSNHYNSKRGRQVTWYTEQHSLCGAGMDRSRTHQNDLTHSSSKSAAWSVALNFEQWRSTHHDSVSFACEGLHVQVINKRKDMRKYEERISPPPSDGNVVCHWSAGSMWKWVWRGVEKRGTGECA